MPNTQSNLIKNARRLAQLRALNLGTHPEEAFDRLSALATRILKTPVTLVSLVEEDHQFFKSVVGLPGWAGEQRWTPMDYSFCQHVVATSSPLIINDASLSPLVADNLAFLELDVVAYVGIPLTLSTGDTLGSFCVIDTVPRAWTEEEIEILNELAESVITELELRAEALRHQRTAEQLSESLETLRRTHHRLKDLEQIKTDMIRIAAHDINNPLSSMRGCVDLLLEEPEKLNPEQLDLLDIINISTTRMTEIVRDILSMERAEEMIANQHDSLFDLNALVQESFADNQAWAKTKQQHFKLQDAGKTMIVMGDRSLIREAIDNLITNAIKYTPAAGEIQVLLRPDEHNEALFEVLDNGYGIPQEMQNHIFEPFYRAHTSETHNVNGTGLGLNLVKRIIERHNGTMCFKSTYQEGSCFSFTLPLEPDTEAVPV